MEDEEKLWGRALAQSLVQLSKQDRVKLVNKYRSLPEEGKDLYKGILRVVWGQERKVSALTKAHRTFTE